MDLREKALELLLGCVERMEINGIEGEENRREFVPLIELSASLADFLHETKDIPGM